MEIHCSNDFGEAGPSPEAVCTCRSALSVRRVLACSGLIAMLKECLWAESPSPAGVQRKEKGGCENTESCGMDPN